MKQKNKDACPKCQQVRVLQQNYITGELVCSKCDKVIRYNEKRKQLVSELRAHDRAVSDNHTVADLETILTQYSNVARYVNDVFEHLTGQRPKKCGIENSDIDILCIMLARQLVLFDRIAALQVNRTDIGYMRMEQTSKRLRDDNYASMYIGEYKPPLAMNEEYRAVELALKQRFRAVIPAYPPLKRSMNKTILADIPEGMTILYHEIDIAGLQFYREESICFCKGNKQSTELRREYSNAVDANAIQIIGHFEDNNRVQTVNLGYIPAKTAAQIAKKKQWGNIQALLNRWWISETDYVKIVVDIIGPDDVAK